MPNDKSMPGESTARVAYDLMKHIADDEKDVTKDRKYWLTLYRQCRKATDGTALIHVLKED